MSDIRLSNKGKAFTTKASAASAQANIKVREDVDTVIEPVDDGFVLKVVHYEEKKEVEKEETKSLSDLNKAQGVAGDDGNLVETQMDTGEKESLERRPKRVVGERRRVPLGTQGPLYVAGKYKDPNFEHRVVNEKPGRIEAFMNAGWEMICITNENKVVGDPHCGRGTKVGTPVRIHVGGDEFGYLMRIKKEWYEEDQAAKQAGVLGMEQGMKDQTNEDKGRYGKVDIR
jgi:hypothetical protein